MNASIQADSHRNPAAETSQDTVISVDTTSFWRTIIHFYSYKFESLLALEDWMAFSFELIASRIY